MRKAGITEAREGDCHYEARGHGRRREAVRVTPQLRQEADLVAPADVPLTGRQALRLAVFPPSGRLGASHGAPSWFFRETSLLWAPEGLLWSYQLRFWLGATAFFVRKSTDACGSSLRCSPSRPRMVLSCGISLLVASVSFCASVESSVARFCSRVPLHPLLLSVVSPRAFPPPLYFFGAVVLSPFPSFLSDFSLWLQVVLPFISIPSILLALPRVSAEHTAVELSFCLQK